MFFAQVKHPKLERKFFYYLPIPNSPDIDIYYWNIGDYIRHYLHRYTHPPSTSLYRELLLYLEKCNYIELHQEFQILSPERPGKMPFLEFLFKTEISFKKKLNFFERNMNFLSSVKNGNVGQKNGHKYIVV